MESARPDVDVDGAVSIPVPEGWEEYAALSRLVGSGLCRYSDLTDGTISISGYFDLLRLADWREYAEAYARAQAKD